MLLLISDPSALRCFAKAASLSWHLRLMSRTQVFDWTLIATLGRQPIEIDYTNAINGHFIVHTASCVRGADRGASGSLVSCSPISVYNSDL